MRRREASRDLKDWPRGAERPPGAGREGVRVNVDNAGQGGEGERVSVVNARYGPRGREEWGVNVRNVGMLRAGGEVRVNVVIARLWALGRPVPH